MIYINSLKNYNDLYIILFIAGQMFFIKIELIWFNSSAYDYYWMEKSLSKYERSQL